ncbi:hypothetical protein [Conchiformibius kuhniae]|uniref:Uncharacterized protein n=1 Tax=Conchiformibius kuhniae TaxID=211502 RepID=A0A8T9MXP7_9NEIS|nr:hypothetical protein [Conchiformibius kuhniae]UOP05196.1 hypothetical protein LVJ77_02840 [Conchiformibius kuhniae]
MPMLTEPRRMRQLLDCLHQRRAPAGGLAFAAVWGKLDLDYRPESLARIAALLRHVHAKQGASAFAVLEKQLAGENFLLTLAAYLAEYVARQSGAAYAWQADGRATFGNWYFKPLLSLRLLLEGQQERLRLDNAVWQAFCSRPDAERGKMAAFALAHYRANRTLPQGLAFAGVPQALKWDFSRADLRRLDGQLAKLARREGFDAGKLPARFARDAERNFILLLAFYIGETLSDGAARWRNTPQRGDAFWDGFVLVLPDGAELPLLRLLADALCGGTTRFADPALLPPPPDPNDAARRAVDAVRRADAQSPPVARRSVLNAVKWDYGWESLRRLDALLDGIRTERPEFDAFVRHDANLNLLHFCAFYLARTAAELSNNTLYFLDYAQAKTHIPDLPHDWFSQYAALIGDKIYFPFGRIASRIWDHAPEESCTDFVRFLQQTRRGTLYRCPRGKSAAQNGETLPELLQKTLRQAGFAAAYALSLRRKLPDRAVFAPMLLKPHPERHWDLHQLMFERTEDALACGMNILNDNPDRLPCMVLAYEGYANLPRGHFDAVMLEIRTYRPHTSALQAALPLRPNADGTWSAGALVLNGNGLADETAALAAAAPIYRGMADFERHTPTAPPFTESTQT